MTSKQLANVLIKVPGFFLCLQGIGRVIYGLALHFRCCDCPGWLSHVRPSHIVVGAIIRLLVGILLVVKSRSIAQCLFKGETE